MTTLALPSLISAATPAEYIVIPLSRYTVIPLYRYIVIPLSPNPLIPKYRPLPFPPSCMSRCQRDSILV